MCSSEPIQDKIQEDESCECDHCGRALDAGSEVHVDLDADEAGVFCSRTCYLLHTDPNPNPEPEGEQ